MDILILLSLILLNAIFAMAEIAVIKTRKARLKKKLKQAIVQLNWRCISVKTPMNFYQPSKLALLP